MIAPNMVMAPFVTVPTTANILRQHPEGLAVPLSIRFVPWPILGLNARELVARRYNRHLDFRVSMQTAEHAVVSTVCTTHFSVPPAGIAAADGGCGESGATVSKRQTPQFWRGR